MKKIKKIITVILSVCCVIGSSSVVFASGAITYADTNMSNNMTLADAKEALKISLGINTSKTVIQENDNSIEKKYDVNNDGKIDLYDAKLILNSALGINRVGVDIPIPDTDEEFSTVEYTDKIVSITNYSDGIKQINFKDSYICVTDNIKIIKDGIEVSVDELKAGSIVTYDCNYVLEMFPAKIIGCTTIIVK